MSPDIRALPPALPASPSCEAHEIEISALLDGELTSQETLALLDHLTRCADCSELYRQCRALDQAVLTADAVESVAPPAGLWDRIAETATLAPPEPTRRSLATLDVRRGGTRGWGLRAAAVLAAAAIALFALRGVDESTSGSSNGSSRPLEVELASDAGAMDDSRFVSLTAELLRSDPRYHRKMLEVLELVANPATDEGSVDDRVIRGALARDPSGREEGGDERPTRTADWRV